MARPARSVLELCLARAGLRRGMRVATFIVQWVIAAAVVPDLGIERWASWWGENERTAYRRLAEFRQHFPELDTPAPFVAPMLAHTPRLRELAEAADRSTSVAEMAAAITSLGELPPDVVFA